MSNKTGFSCTLTWIQPPQAIPWIEINHRYLLNRVLVQIFFIYPALELKESVKNFVLMGFLKKISCATAAAATLLCSLVQADNNDVVVLVHGLGGNAESFQYRAELESAGLKTIAVEVNGYAGNHDRAAELYAQLKGLRVDYGACHSAEQGHLQFGEDFTGKGLYPQWDENHRIHLVGHSMGGITIRHLERLLEDGSGCAQDTSPLYKGGNNWITSVTTMASPMDGTTVFDDVIGGDDLLIKVFIGFNDFEDGGLDFPQWGLVQGPTESFDDYLERVEDSGLFSEEDFSAYELKIEGATKFNNAGPQIYPGRYYFSYASERTNPERDCTLGILFCETIEEPDRKMSSDLKPSGKIIGKNAGSPDNVNDGIVNQARAKCPTGKNCKMIADSSTLWNPSQWHVILLDFLDHYQITDRDSQNDANNFAKSAKRIYLEHGLRLKALPSLSRNSDLSDEEIFVASEKAASVRRFLNSKLSVHSLRASEVSEETPVASAVFALLAIVALSVGTAVGVLKGALYLRKQKRITSGRQDFDEGKLSKVTL